MAPKIDYVDLLKKAGITKLQIADEDGEDDLSRLAPAFRVTDNANALIKSAAGAVDYGALISSLMPMLIAFIQAQLNKPKPEPVPTAPAPTPTPAPAPGPTPTPAPGPKARTITSFRGKYHQVVRNDRTVNDEDFKAIKARTGKAVEKDRIVCDYSPLDQSNNEIRDGEWTEELKAAMFFSNGTHRCRYYGINHDIAHITMNHALGLMPRIKIDDQTLAKGEVAETGEIFGLYYTDGAAPTDDDPDTNRPHIKMPPLHSLLATGREAK